MMKLCEDVRKKELEEKGKEQRREQMGAPLKESNALCALRQHMVLLLTQRAVQSQLKCALQKEVKNVAGFQETVPDLK